MKQHRPPSDEIFRDQFRRLGDRLGKPFPFAGQDWDEKEFYSWVRDVGWVLIQQQPEFKRRGRRRGPSHKIFSEDKEAVRKRAYMERRQQGKTLEDLEARIAELSRQEFIPSRQSLEALVAEFSDSADGRVKYVLVDLRYALAKTQALEELGARIAELPRQEDFRQSLEALIADFSNSGDARVERVLSGLRHALAEAQAVPTPPPDGK
jgi:hypothetical protein